MWSSSLTVYNLCTVVRAILNMYMLPFDDDFACTWLTTRFVVQRVPLVEQELLVLTGVPEFNLGLHELHIAQFIVFCRSLFVFFLLSIVFSLFNLCLLITTLVCQIFLMIISTHFNNIFSKWFLYVFAQFTAKWFHPYTQLSGTYGRRACEMLIFFLVRSTTFLLNVQARDIVKSRGTNVHRYQYLRVGCVFDLSSKSIGRQSDRSLQWRSYSRFNKLRGY